MDRTGKRKRGALLILLAMIMTGILGCQSNPDSSGQRESYVIGVVTKSRDSEYWMSVVSGMEKAASDLGVSVVTVSPDTETSDIIQKKMIDNLLKRDIDALAISPVDSYHAQEYLEKAREKGISVFAYDTQILNAEVPYIGIDNEKAGQEVAKYIAEQLGNQGIVGIISGNLNQTAHELRTKGFQEYLKQNTDIKVAFLESGYSNLQMSEREISRLMEENPELSGIFATSAVTALGIMEYMKDKPVLIATVDAQEDAIEAVKAGRIAALVSQSGYDIGYETIRYIINQRDGIEQEMKKILNVEILTKDTKF